jgi:hypothetical protein
MVPLSTLWLPLVLSAIAVFFASFVLHTLLPWHRSEYPAVPDQDRVMDALRPFAIPPGDYMLPRAANMNELRAPDFKAKVERGPVVIMTVLPNRIVPMGSLLAKWFVYVLVVTLFAAYVAGRALGFGAEYLQVFRFIGATAFAGYVLALWQMNIWYHRSFATTVRATIDGLVYALLTAGFFGWLWPR